MRPRVFFLLGAALLTAGLTVAQAPTGSALRPGRLYFGAPPAVPHDMGPDMNECLVCHGEEDMGAPLSPHPTRLRCRQCHVAGEETEGAAPFRASKFRGLSSPGRAPRLQPAGPPLIPHQVLLRENCLTCHAPEAREDVISTTHPERLRCRQCHIPQHSAVAPFPRSPEE